MENYLKPTESKTSVLNEDLKAKYKAPSHQHLHDALRDLDLNGQVGGALTRRCATRARVLKSRSNYSLKGDQAVHCAWAGQTSR